MKCEKTCQCCAHTFEHDPYIPWKSETKEPCDKKHWCEYAKEFVACKKEIKKRVRH